MLTFFVTVHARPPEAQPGPTITLAGRDVSTLRVPPQSLSTTTFACGFEDAASALALLPRMYCEPDGSFVWASSHGEPAWQVDGNLYDRAERLLFVDLKGTCPAERFDELLRAFGWPAQAVVFQLTREAVFLDEAEFRRLAAS